MSSIPEGDNITRVNSVGGSGELNSATTTGTRPTSSPLRFKASSNGWPILEYSEIGALIDFNVSDELLGRDVIKATLHIRLTGWAAQDYGSEPLYMDIVGLIGGDIDDWVDYSTPTSSNVSYDYYKRDSFLLWQPPIYEYNPVTHGGLGTSYPFGLHDDFWGVATDTTITSVLDEAELTFNVTEQVQAWAGGENEGGFLLFGERVGSALLVFGNINWDDSYRPYLEVYIKE